MNQPLTTTPPVSRKGDPTWEIAQLFPLQGSWTEEEYFALDTNRLVEFDNGFLEVLPMPTTHHHRILRYLFKLLDAFATAHDLGEVLMAGVAVRLWEGKYREPDILFMRKEHEDRAGNKFWDGADLVMEIVSGSRSDRERDLVEKPEDYARGRIPEYWIIDPEEETITVLRIARKHYVVHGKFRKDETATSHLLPGFEADVTTALSQRPPDEPKKKVRKQPPPQ